MRLTVVDRGPVLFVSSPDVPGWSRAVRGRDALWHAVSEAHRRMPRSTRAQTWPVPENDGTAYARQDKTVGMRQAAQQRRAQLVAMLEGGSTVAAIARHFNVSEATIYNDFGTLNIRREQAS